MVPTGSFHALCSSATRSPIRTELPLIRLSDYAEPLLSLALTGPKCLVAKGGIEPPTHGFSELNLTSTYSKSSSCDTRQVPRAATRSLRVLGKSHIELRNGYAASDAEHFARAHGRGTFGDE